MNELYPYSLLITDESLKQELFVADVENLLNGDLQREGILGCKISDCHAKLGSKKHTECFIEAELLFHNGYYNKGFAYLTASKISSALEEGQNILVIGYESYSELFVCETISLLKVKYPLRQIEYGIFSAKHSANVPIRLAGSVPQDPLVVVVVPISTTLSTFEKVLGHVRQKITFRSLLNISLIVLGKKDDNDYWEQPERGKKILVLQENQQKRLKQLNDSKIHYFAMVDQDWYDVHQCKHCFPNTHGRELIDENVVFGVNRESIVPMLRLGTRKALPPFDKEKENHGHDNLKRILALAPVMHYGHIARNDCHHQYYIETAEYFQRESRKEDKNKKDNIQKWLEAAKDNLGAEPGDSGVIKRRIRSLFDISENESTAEIAQIHFVVAPRHFSNAGLVQKVNDIVFSGSARIIYFDVNHDFRSNVLAKYSDISSLIENIRQSQCKTAVMFHFVDDTIYSGDTYHRCKSIIHSLINEGSRAGACKIDVFTSIFVLVGRHSRKSVLSLVESEDRFMKYVHLSVSPLRCFEDACPICKTRQDNKRIAAQYAATNAMASSISKFVRDSRVIPVGQLDDSNTDSTEWFFRMAYSHMFNELLDGNLTMKEVRFPVFRDKTISWGHAKKFQIDSQDWLDVNRCIFALYRNEENKKPIDGVDLLGDVRLYYNPTDLNGKLLESAVTKSARNETLRKLALINVISRPFFAHQLRFRQAAFRFCIWELHRLLNELSDKEGTERNSGDLSICCALLTALSDMNANFIIRAQTLPRLFGLASDSPKDPFSKQDIFKAVKRLTVLSDDDAKSLLLEYILVDGNEQGFFKSDADTVFPLLDFRDALQLYIENTKILKDGFADLKGDMAGNSYLFATPDSLPYYLEDFYKVFSVNSLSVNSRFADWDNFGELYTMKSKTTLEDLSFTEMCKSLAAFLKATDKYDVVSVFVEDTLVTNSYWDRYYVCAGDGLDKSTGKERVAGAIYSLLKKDRQIANTLWIDSVNENMIIKICGNSCQDSVYIYLKAKQRHCSVRHFFFIRLLLLLRNTIATKIDGENHADIIDKQKNARIANALSLSKAGNHMDANMEIFFRKEWIALNERDQEHKSLPEMSLFANALMIIANTKIAEIYRSFVKPSSSRKQNLDETEYGMLSSETLKEYGFEDKGDAWELRFASCVDDSPITVRICVSVSNEDGVDLLIKDTNSLIAPLVWLIFLLTGNALKHRPKDPKTEAYLEITECLIKVTREENYLVVSSIYSNKTEQTPLEKVNVDEIRGLLEIPPALSDENAHRITLWTLNQMIREQNPSDSLLVHSDDDNGFTLKIKLLGLGRKTI